MTSKAINDIKKFNVADRSEWLDIKKNDTNYANKRKAGVEGYKSYEKEAEAAQWLKLSAIALSPKQPSSERFSPYKIYPMRTIKIKYAILYLLSIHFMNTVYSTIISIVTFYSPHISKLSAIYSTQYWYGSSH